MKVIPHITEKEFSSLYQRLTPRLLLFAYNWCGDRSLAEDLVQDTFIKIWNKRFELKPTDQLDGLLYTVLRNLLIDQYQKKLKEQTVITELQVTGGQAEENDRQEGDQQSQTLLKVESYIKDLPPRCQEAFLMSRRDGMTYKQIATVRSVSVKSVEKHISKAIKILNKRLMQGYFYFF